MCAKTYPSNLPEIAIGRNELCITCSYVWIDPCDSSQPDFNHCQPMLDTANILRNLTQNQREAFKKLVEQGVQCPFFSSKEEGS